MKHFKPSGLKRRWRWSRHPWDRGYITTWEQELAAYWLRNTSNRRHTQPFAKTIRGLQRRIERRGRLRQKGATT